MNTFIGIKTYNRTSSLEKCLNSILKTTSSFTGKLKIIISDDCSSNQNHINFLKQINYPHVSVIFHSENKGSNGNTQRLLNYFFENQIEKWILIDDDCVFLKTGWLEKALSTMNLYPHLYQLPRYKCPVGHPHGFFMTGTYNMLSIVGPYNLKEFPLKYGDAHADFSFRCKSLGFGQSIELPIEYNTILNTPSANESIKQTFLKKRHIYDKKIKSFKNYIIPWTNGNLNYIKK